MQCPYCKKELSETALRCRYCRRVVSRHLSHPLKDILLRTRKALSHILSTHKDSTPCPWSLIDVAFVVVLMALFLMKDPLGVGSEIIKFLRLHFFIFTRDPRLLYHLSIYISTIIFKILFITFVFISVKLHRASIRDTVISGGTIPRSWHIYLPLYVGLSIVFRIIAMSNPLVPNLPFRSVLTEATVIGNTVAIFSILFVAPLLEEISFRGFLYPALNKYIGMYPSICVTSIFFTLAHYPQIKNSFIFASILLILSVIITYARAKTGSTIVAIILHFIYNFVSIAVGVVNFFILKP